MDKQLLANLMNARSLSISELAEKVGVSVDTVLNWLTGASQPREGNLQKLAEVFEVSINDLANPIRISKKDITILGKEIGISQEEIEEMEKMSVIEQLYFLSRLISRRLYYMQIFQDEIDKAIGRLFDAYVSGRSKFQVAQKVKKQIVEVL